MGREGERSRGGSRESAGTREMDDIIEDVVRVGFGRIINK